MFDTQDVYVDVLLKQLHPMQVSFPRGFAIMPAQEPSPGTENIKSMSAPSEKLFLPTGLRFPVGFIQPLILLLQKGSRGSRSYHAEVH